jgi:hypothetical protein
MLLPILIFGKFHVKGFEAVPLPDAAVGEEDTY